MSTADSLEVAVAVMKARAGQDDQSVVTDLIERGVPSDEAEWLVTLVPIAFTHVLFSGRGPTFATTFQCMGEDRRVSLEYPLSGEPIYTHAVEAASKADRETMSAVASRSAEFSLINQALLAGSRIDDLKLIPPIFIRVSRPIPPKRWWRFW